MESEVQLLLGAMALGYGILFVISAWLVLYMRHHRSGALRGDTRAARKVLLPAFQPLLWLLTIVALLYSICFTLLVFGRPRMTTLTRVEAEIFYSGRLFVIALPVLYLQQRAVTTRALIRAALYSLLLALYNVPIVWLMDLKARPSVAHYVTMLTEAFPLSVFGWMCLRPLERASQTTLREYVVFVGIYYAFRLTYKQLKYMQIDLTNASVAIALACIFWGSLVPVVILRVLKADTAHWRGLGRRAAHLQSLFRQRYHQLHECISSRGLHVLIEMHRKQIIDFAYLELQLKIGAGTNAVVFRGTLYSKFPVAIKVYTPRVLNEDVVAEFSHEAALCSALQHPNVVRFYGMCVCPPTVCLVSELCQGSLEDVTRASARMQLLNQRRRRTVHDEDATLEEPHRRQQFLIDLNYMIDATRAVVYMHSFTPAFLHRDLKPSNFLVDDFGTCKLTDFGESRSIPAMQKTGGLNRMTEDSSTAATVATSSTLFFGETYTEVQTPGTVSQIEPTTISLRPSLRDRGRSAMTVRGTADYMAPELIEGKAGTAVYGEAADIYSLAITLWDIVHPLVPKYPEATRSHLQVFDSVLNGERPPISPTLHPVLHQLLSDAWHQQPERRPSATYILTVLETLQEEVCAQTALDLAAHDDTPFMVTGKDLMQRMVELDFVDTASEAYRMGSSLMSAGILHHSQHQAPFHKTSEMFYFDEDKLNLHASASDFIDDQRPSNFVDRCNQQLLSKKRRRATDCPKPTRCFSPFVEKKRSSTTACHRPSLEVPACACRKLGRDFGNPEFHQKRRFRRNKKWFSITEERISTGKLHALGVESQPYNISETDEFDVYGINRNFPNLDCTLEENANVDEIMDFDTDGVDCPSNTNLGSSVVII